MLLRTEESQDQLFGSKIVIEADCMFLEGHKRLGGCLAKYLI